MSTIITDGRTLRAMINAGCISETKYGNYPQVDHNNNDDWEFTWSGKQYRLKYFDGSFYPYVTIKEPRL